MKDLVWHHQSAFQRREMANEWIDSIARKLTIDEDQLNQECGQWIHSWQEGDPPHSTKGKVNSIAWEGKAGSGFEVQSGSGSLRLRVGCLIVQAVMIVSCTWTGGSLFLSNGEEDRNMPLTDSTETKMGCQERRGGRMGSWSDLVWIVHGR